MSIIFSSTPGLNVNTKAKNYSGKGEVMCPKDGWVVIRGGRHLAGNLCKGTMGGGTKEGVFYSLIRDHSTKLAAQMMARISRFSARWISNYGMTIGISDVTPFSKLIKAKRELISEGKEACEHYIKQYNSQTLELRPGCNAEQSLESYLAGHLGSIR